jgi:N-acylneuraminate cytidylyltransferase
MNDSTLVVIPARGGSKGIPGKNIKLLAGKPLILYTIEEARNVFRDDQIIVSTDSHEIKQLVEETGLKVPFMRPAELATDTSTTQDVLLHVVEIIESGGYYPDVIVLLQPTSPFRNAKHIKEALSLFNMDLDMVVSVKKSAANPYFNLFEEDKKGFMYKSKEGGFTRRQDCPEVYELNGAIYIINLASLKDMSISKFKRIIKYEMDSFNSIDIDTYLDWLVCETILQHSMI